MNQNFDPSALKQMQTSKVAEQSGKGKPNAPTSAAETRSPPCLKAMRPGEDGQDPRLSTEEAWDSAQRISRRVEDSFHAQHGRYPNLTTVEDYWLLAEHFDVAAEQKLAPFLAWYEITHSLIRNFIERREQGLFLDLNDQQRTLVFDAVVGRILYSPPSHELEWQLAKLNILLESDTAEVVKSAASAFTLAVKMNKAVTSAYQRDGATFLNYQFADSFFKPMARMLANTALVCEKGLTGFKAKLNKDLVRAKDREVESAGYSYYK